jgi:hypothetical protein
MTGSNLFKRAERKQVKLKLAVTGPSGSGKTFSALRIAKGLGGKVAVIDTENGSASLYADQFEFDVINLEPPFTTEKYTSAFTAAVEAGYNVLVVDSLTHAWAGEGGLLEQKEQLDARGKGNGYTNWATITKKHEAFKSAMLQAEIHVVATIRSKQDYILQERDGKQVPKKVGMAPIQREGLEYEFAVVFDVAMNHEAEASKDRTSLFAGKIFKITEKTGQELLDWLSSAKPADAKVDPKEKHERDRLNAIIMKIYKPFMTKNPGLEFAKFLHTRYNVGEIGKMAVEQVNDLIVYMENTINQTEEEKKAVTSNVGQ